MTDSICRRYVSSCSLPESVGTTIGWAVTLFPRLNGRGSANLSQLFAREGWIAQ